MSDVIKIALISGVVSVVTATITAIVPVIGTVARTESAATKAEGSAKTSEASLAETKRVLAAVPGAIATHFRGTKRQNNATGERFNFSSEVYDPESAVTVGDDWRMIVPVDGVYYLGATYALPYGPNGSSHINPYVKCELYKVKANTTKPERISIAIAFTPACSINGVFSLSKGDQIYSNLGKAGAYDGSISGEFFSVLIGDGKQGANNAN